MNSHDPILLERLRALKDFLRGEIIGQDEAIDTIVPYLQAGELGLASPERPKASFLFLGPTGVGKTELATCFTRYLLGQDLLLRLDMSEYQHPNSIERLLGGSGSPGILQDRMGRAGCLLLDEIEKAHPAILDLLLQILDAGRLTLANGKELDFSPWYVVLTSNIASLAIARSRQNGAALERFVQAQAQRYLRPELVGRLDAVLVFHRLLDEALSAIQEKFVEREASRLERLGYRVDRRVTSSRPTDRGGARSAREEVLKELRGRLLAEILN